LARASGNFLADVSSQFVMKGIVAGERAIFVVRIVTPFHRDVFDTRTSLVEARKGPKAARRQITNK
jgi:hypothetical protein